MKIPNFKHSYGYAVGNAAEICYCCGARATTKVAPTTQVSNPGMGIRVFPGKVGKEMLTDKTEVSHVETSAGPLTVTVRHG